MLEFCVFLCTVVYIVKTIKEEIKDISRAQASRSYYEKQEKGQQQHLASINRMLNMLEDSDKKSCALEKRIEMLEQGIKVPL